MRTAVIGGGPSGVMAAGTAAKNAEVVLFEKNDKILKKLYITGKGRCNITNASGGAEFLANVIRGGRFLFSALAGFSPDDAMDFFRGYGLKLKVERGNRVFPESDKSSDIIKVFERFLSEAGVAVRLNSDVSEIKRTSDGRFEITVKNCGTEPRFKEAFDRIVVATGGLSYPATGSSGAGYKFAGAFGHKIVALRPALTAVKVFEDIKALEGLSLKNVSATAYYCEKAVFSDGGEQKGRNAAVDKGRENMPERGQPNGRKTSIGGRREIFSEFGEMLFTDDSLSGPLILSMSGRINRLDLKTVGISVDLKPALSEEALDARILRDFKGLINKNFSNALDGLLPKSLIPYIIKVTGIPPFLKVNELDRERRGVLVGVLKNLVFTPACLASIESAIVTSGGIDLSEINPKTMESKLVKNLFFVGETLDADALTGGFNLQIAMSTGYACGRTR